MNPFDQIPQDFIKKWQGIADLLANIINIPSALIMKNENEFMEVFVSSQSENNPYSPGDKEHWYGLYCETVIKSQKELLIPNALKDKKWDKNPDIKLGMIAYLGLPLNFPDKTPFGTICILDSKENKFTKEQKELLEQFRNTIELDLALIQTLHIDSADNIVAELQNQNKELVKEKEKAQQNEEKFSTIFNMSQSLVCIADINTATFKYTNPSFHKILGYTDDELLNKPFFEFIHPNDIKRTSEVVEKELKAGKPVITFENRYRRKDGNYRWLNWNSFPVPEKGITYAIAHDVTHMKETEKDLKHKNEEYAAINEELRQTNEELLEAKQKAEESEDKYRALYLNAPLSYQSLDENGCFIDVNPMWLKTLGYKRNEVIGKWYGDFLHPDYIEHFKKNFPEFKNRGYISDIQFRLRKKDNTYILVSFEGCVGYTPEGHFRQTYCTFKDITAEYIAEQKLTKAKEQAEENEKKLLEAQALSHVGNWDYDIETGTVFWSKELKNIFELSHESPAPGYSAQKSFYTPESFKKMDKAVQKCIQHGTPYEIELDIITTSGAVKQIISKATAKKKNQKIIGLYGTAQDITRQKKLEKALIKAKEQAEKNELKYKTIFEASPLGIFRSTKEGKFLEVNKSLAVMLGYDNPKEVLDNISDISKQIYVSSEKRKEIMSESGLNKVSQYENIYKRKNGDTFYANVYLREIKDENGQIVLQGIVEDTSKRKQYENDLKDAIIKVEESSRLKTAFLSNLSHEIRTPLNAIYGFTGMLDNRNISQSKRDSFIKVIQDSSDQLLSVVSDVLTISSLETKQEKLYTEAVNLNEIVVQLYTKYKPKADNSNIALYMKQGLNAQASLIYADGDKLKIALNNLITNALKFTSKGFVEFGYSPPQVNKSQTELTFFVKDTGIGIPFNQQQNIFEPFRQAGSDIQQNYGGTGLGLSISKGFVEMMGGKIWTESEQGKGANFYFTIPYKPVNSQSNEYSEENNAKIIIVAEDEEYNFLYIQEILIQMNFRLIHAKNGKEAVDLFEKYPKTVLILMDIKMPIMDGYTAARQIKEMQADIPVIAQTAYGLRHEINRYKDIFDDYLAKPIKANILREKVKTHISQNKKTAN